MKKIYLTLFLFLFMRSYALAASAATTVEYVTTTATQPLPNKTLDASTLKNIFAADPTLVLRLGTASHIAPWTVGTSLPSSCSIGDAHFLTSAAPGSNLFICPAPNTWLLVAGGGGGGGGTGDVSSTTTTSVDSEIALFSGTTGKVIKRSAVSGLLKSSSGVIASWQLQPG